MRTWLLLCFLFAAQPALCGQAVWQSGNFALYTGGWYSPAAADYQGWKGLLLGVEMPDTGVMLLSGAGALEVYIPSKGWVRDLGITVWNGCAPTEDMQDTALYGATLTADMRCTVERNRVLMIARIPRNKTKGETLPTKARWVSKKEMHYEAAD